MHKKEPTGNRVEDLREICRQRGLRVTPQRIEVFREVVCSSEHPPVDVILKRVRKRIPNISLDTVYRILYWLEDEGLISRVQMASERVRFDGNASCHHHFVCSQCGEIRDFLSDDVEQLQLPDEVRSWGRIEDRHLQVRGTCQTCLRKGTRKKTG
jgi:Fur family transcriptional regulator, peroxide stress response regulator